MKTINFFICLLLFAGYSFAQDVNIQNKMKKFDKEMVKNLKDWNIPGVGVGIVKDGKLVFVKGYGYRDYDKKLPITANTLFQIASNTKLFTSTAMGFLVNEGKMDWDKPVKNFVPTIQFYNNDLTNNITIRDMLSHRTGVTRHDLIWYKSDFTRKEFFEKLKYLEPSQPLRQGYLYNNLMYASAGHIIELLENKTWENYVQEKILKPLKMTSTVFSIAEMEKQNDIFVPYNEKRDSTVLYKIKYNSDTDGLGPAGSLISNINDLSHWLSALMNKGMYEGNQVIPESIVEATMEPSIVLPNYTLEQGFTEVLNPVYGMGRQTESYRGHQLVLHGGHMNGINSQISYMPQDKIGVILFVIGDHSLSYDAINYNIYEHLLGLTITPWSERYLKNRDVIRKVAKAGRRKATVGQIPDTKPSHSLSDYLGNFENDAYGIFSISQIDDQMMINFHHITLPLNHFHYDRFDTINDEVEGFFSLNFQTNPQGDVDRFIASLDQGEVTFIKKADEKLNTVEVLTKYTGKYKIGSTTVEVFLKDKNHLYIEGSPDMELIPYKPNRFKLREISDAEVEFILENGKVKSMMQKMGTGQYEIMRDDSL